MRFAAAVVLLNLALFMLWRAIFWLWFRSTAPDADGGTFVQAWYLGFKFDLRLALILILPIAAFCWIPALNPAASRIGRRVWFIYLVAAAEILAMAYIIDMGHYDYLHERLNANALEHVLSPDIAGEMVMQSYPVWLAVPVLGLFGWGYAWVMGRLAFRQLDVKGAPLAKWPKVGAIAAGVLLLLGGLYGKLSWYPLRWSDAFYTTHPFASALASNPVLYFFETLSISKIQVDPDKVRRDYDLVADHLGVTDRNPAALNFTRRATPESKLPVKPNIVIIYLESFAAFKSGLYGNPLDPTPQFDAIASKGIRFKYCFVPRPPTARSIFASLFGIPDVHPIESASRNPMIVRQHTIVNAFEGYEKRYFLGGSASWGNIRGMLYHNIPELKIYEEGDYVSPRADVWGVDDLHLLEEASGHLAKLDKPFIAYIQTAGNHRPYTIPPDNRGFQVAQADEAKVIESGFHGVDDFNAMRFMDHAIGNFFRVASKEAYFKNTIFVMHGDHGVRGPAKSPWKDYDLDSHHVPCVIYAPALFEPKVIETVTSSVNVLPTLAGLAGVPYTTATLGRDIFDPHTEQWPFAFIDNGNRIGVADNEYLMTIDAAGAERLYRYRSGTPSKEITAELPDKAAELARLCRALYETSKYMLYNNKPQERPK